MNNDSIAPRLKPRRPMPEGPTIRQQELREYRGLQQQAKKIAENLQAARQKLLEQLLGGADIEPGPFSVKVRHIELRRITQAKIRAAFGQATLDKVLARIPPTKQEQLLVSGPNIVEDVGDETRCPSGEDFDG